MLHTYWPKLYVSRRMLEVWSEIHSYLKQSKCTLLASYRHTLLASYRHTLLASYRHTLLASYMHTLLASYMHTDKNK